MATDVNPAGTRFIGDPLTSGTPRRAISLVDAELNDDGTITHTAPSAADVSDFKLIRQSLGSRLLDGDTDFVGRVTIADLNTVRGNFGQSNRKWSQGDFNFDGRVTIADLNATRANFGQQPPAAAVASAGAATIHLLARSPASAAANATVQAVTPANPDPVRLVVNTETGEVRIVNEVPSDPGEMGSYEITSAGSLLATAWHSLAQQGAPGNWSELIRGNDYVAEATSSASAFAVVPDGGFLLGNLFRPGSLQDLAFNYGDETNGTFAGEIVYVPEPSGLAVLCLSALVILPRRRSR